ncbi:hypothetical protein COLO4_10018 [Corchorus olitorius]|uniref:Uncharacterized protein n=1 Tax=Corchorus olitorius TaxID=93759 RepID=A0A1R3KA98_9ROSI|nr:hypothetical protein COLO4_10018 [Corchorus olitorius]
MEDPAKNCTCESPRMRLTPFEVAQYSFADPVVKLRLLDLRSEFAFRQHFLSYR